MANLATTTKTNPRRPRRHGLTLTDVIISLLILCVLTSLAFSDGGLLRARDHATRARCASNLRQIGQALHLYANENRGRFPRVVYAPDAPPTWHTGVDAKNPFAADAPVKPNDVTAAAFLLVRTVDVGVEAFVCPATDVPRLAFKDGKTAADFANFPADRLGYSFANPYPGKAALESGYRWDNRAAADFAVAADMNPGTFGGQDVTTAKGPKDAAAPAADLQRANSLNHRGAGQNVLYGDGHVSFETTPFAGTRRDNIYTSSAGNGGDNAATSGPSATGLPAWAGDSVLTPVATANPHTRTPAQVEAEALAEFRRDLPRLRAMIAEEEAKNGQTPQVVEFKKKLAEAEKEADETAERLKQK